MDNGFPKTVHLIYIPWDKKQRLKHDHMDFDKVFWKKFEQQLKRKGWKVMMWTRDKIEKFMEMHYSREWKLVKRLVARPVQLVDYLRWKIIYHYGGIYWQYGSFLKAPINSLIPPQIGGALTLTETTCNFFRRYWMGTERIRFGKPEEKTRVATQVFSAYPRNGFVQSVIDKNISNLRRYKVKCDYDILYIGGNAMVSEVYDECKQDGSIHKFKVTILSYEASQDIAKFSSEGSWRTNNTVSWLYLILLSILILLIIYYYYY